MTFFGTRLIVRADDAEAVVAKYVESLGDAVAETGRGEPGSGLEWKTRWRVTPDSALHFGWDTSTSAPYVFYTAELRNVAIGRTEHAIEHLPVYSRDELLEALDGADAPADRARALLLVALGAPHTFDSEVFVQIQHELVNPDAEVRRAAVYAMTYSPSRLYRPALSQLVRAETDPGVRNVAARMLAIFDQLGIGDCDGDGNSVGRPSDR